MKKKNTIKKACQIHLIRINEQNIDVMLSTTTPNANLKKRKKTGNPFAITEDIKRTSPLPSGPKLFQAIQKMAAQQIMDFNF